MRVPRFTTLQLLLVTTLAALLAGLLVSAWRMRSTWYMATSPGHSATKIYRGEHVSLPSEIPLALTTTERLYVFRLFGLRIVPLLPAAMFTSGFAIWAAAWGIVRKRTRESLAKFAASSPGRASPLALRVCWGLMIVGGLVALAIPIVLMFTIGPWLFPTIYFSLFVGLAAIARGASRDNINLDRTAALQLANMIALDPANVVFAAMEFALLRTANVREYLKTVEEQP
jgi:hypothetical protein